MPTNAKRITRLVKLLQKLQGGRGSNLQGLAKLLGVGGRTVYRDLEALRLAGVSVEHNRQTKRYWIASGAFHAPKNLTVEEVFSIWALAHSVGQHPHIPFYESVQNAVGKLQRELSASQRRKIARMAKSIEFMPLKVSRLATKTGLYQTIVDAIESRRAFRMTYASASKPEQLTTNVCAYKLLFSEYSWYIIGHSSMHSEVRTFNLLRVDSVTLLSKRFSVPKGFQWQSRVGNSWTAVPEPGRDHHVIIKFAPMVARNVALVEWHKTQQTKLHSDGSLLFRATVSGLSEISWWIMRYGEHAEVMHPLKLRKLIAKRASKMAAMYAETINRFRNEFNG